jgi:hypothetical protein
MAFRWFMAQHPYVGKLSCTTQSPPVEARASSSIDGSPTHRTSIHDMGIEAAGLTNEVRIVFNHGLVNFPLKKDLITWSL